MAIPKQPSVAFLLLALVTLSFTTTSSAAHCSSGENGSISVYWGQGSKETEGTLKSVCSTGNYNIVILGSLLVYDDSRTPVLNLGDHCGAPDYPCSKLEPEIEYCQQNDIKVFLSIGRVMTQKTRSRHSNQIVIDPAKELASYLLENYLSGQRGPLGKVSLDGIDIADVPDGRELKWDKLVKAINASTTERNIYLSAAPQCVYPDYYLDTAINTGLVDYIWVKFFYQNPCIYEDGDATNLFKAWRQWTKNVPESSIFLGLVAYDDVAGYIPADALRNEVLPKVKKASNYGGVMIFETNNKYSGQIKDDVLKGCTSVHDDEDALRVSI